MKKSELEEELAGAQFEIRNLQSLRESDWKETAQARHDRDMVIRQLNALTEDRRNILTERNLLAQMLARMVGNQGWKFGDPSGYPTEGRDNLLLFLDTPIGQLHWDIKAADVLGTWPVYDGLVEGVRQSSQTKFRLAELLTSPQLCGFIYDPLEEDAS